MNKAEADKRKAEFIQARLNNPCATLEELGKKLGVSRERVRQVLKESKVVNVKAYHEKKLVYCLNCGTETDNQQFCSRDCWKKYKTIEVACSQCHGLFTIGQADLIARTKRHSISQIFCSYKCNGQWAGTNYGFAAHPENVTKNIEKRNATQANKTPEERSEIARKAWRTKYARLKIAKELDNK